MRAAARAAEAERRRERAESDGTTALHWAVYRNDVDARSIGCIKAGANVNAANDFGSTPMSEAAVIGNVEVIEKLLKAGADPEVAERGWPDRADGPGAHQQRRSREGAPEAQGERERGGAVARPDGADVGGGAEPAGDGEAAHQARRERRTRAPW